MKSGFPRFHVLFLGSLAVAVTLCVAFVADPAPHGPKFVIELAFLVLAELVATLALGVIPEKDDVVIPLRAALVPISAGYVVFVLLMAAVGFFTGLSTAGFLSMHLVGLAILVALFILVDMSERHVRLQDNLDRAALTPKKAFVAEARVALEEAKSRFPGRKDLLLLAEKRVEALQYAATSRPGSERADNELSVAVAEMSRSASDGDETAFEDSLREVDRWHRIRQMTIKSL